MDAVKIRRFLAVDAVPGSGLGLGSGRGEGSGEGSGWGLGWGSGWGSGLGSGWGSGSGLGSGRGEGSGLGSGSGSGEGSGEGEGWGLGRGSGSGWGSGSGLGLGEGLGSVNGRALYSIDGIYTTIRQIMGNCARGAILNQDLTLTPCYIAKHGRFFAHGETLKQAMEAAADKALQGAPEADRVAAFVAAHEKDAVYPNTDFFLWHHNLTGSCEAGRKAFARDHDIDMSGSMTVMEFIELTEDAYGGATIKKLREFYE